MSYSQQTLVSETRQILRDNSWHDICTEAMDTTEVGIDVADGTQYVAGDIVEFQDDGELCLVTTVVANALTVIRNYLFSVTTTAGTGTTHSINADIVKNPTYRYVQITQAVAKVLRSLWPGVYKKSSSTITPVAGTYWYKVADDIVGLSTIVQKEGDNVNLFFYGTPEYPVSLGHNLPSGFPASSTVAAVRFQRFRNTTNAIDVVGIARLNDDVTTSNYDDVSEGIESDCVTYLTVADLVAATDVERMTGSDVSQGEASVAPLDRTQLAEYWRSRGREARYLWEAELRANLPKMGEL